MRFHIINKRVKGGILKIKKPSKNIKFNLGTLSLIFACLMLLIISTFTQIKFNYVFIQPFIVPYINCEYIPQVPVVIFIAALLGSKWGVFTILLYILLGFFYPIYGLGGGLNYIFQYTFGYIFAFIPASFFCARELKKNNSFFHALLAPFYGVLIIHIIGIVYMCVISFLKGDSLIYMNNLIIYQSLSTILFDLVFSLIAVIFAKICRKLLWIIIG